MNNLDYDYESSNDTEKITRNQPFNMESIKNKLFNISHMIVEDKGMVQVLKMATKVAKVDTTVLILGETGVGKEGIAKYIHYSSDRHNNPFITVNCGAIPENLIESELFGYEGGAFTGANKCGKVGLFQLAHGGTIFLDEVGELPLEVQVKLLRVLQEHQIEKVGSAKSIDVDVRVLAATNRNLKELIDKRQFREDLYYRLSVFPIEIPPLRERKSDIIPLINYFTEDINKKYNFNCSFSQEALDYLYSYEWKGNIRELRNVVERNIVMKDSGLIEKDDLPDYITCCEKEQEFIFGINNFSIKGYSLKDIIQKIEGEIIEDALSRYGNIRMASKALGIDPSTLTRKRRRFIK